MRYLIAGGAGMLGRDLARMLDGRDVTALGRAELDITDESALRRVVPGHDVIINAAAYTQVDAAESHEAEALAINATGAAHLASAAAEVGARFVQLSTDYVFDGAATSPYPEDALRDPKGAYGRTKAEGERLVLEAHPSAYLVRTAWLYGAHGRNFARTMLRLAGQRETVSVVADQVGQPTWTLDLAAAIVRLLDTDAPSGIYHGTNSGQASWFEFARAIFAVSGLDPERVLPIDSAAYPVPAPRPAYSVLGHDAWRRAGLAEPRDWHEALSAAAAEGALATT
jgi:dTDP-4-dehydrorhamnose reductase